MKIVGQRGAGAMIPQSLQELDKIREECRAMVTKRAAASGIAAIVPIPGTDIAADIGMLMELLPAISRRFGLSNEQIEQLDDKTKVLVVQIARKVGSAFVGQVITKELIMQVLKKIAGRVAAKQILKFIPFAGQVAAATISFTAMKYVGNSHVDECYNVVRKVLEKQTTWSWDEEVAATSTYQENNIDDVAGASKQEIMEILKGLKELFDAGIINEEEFQQKKRELLSRL